MLARVARAEVVVVDMGVKAGLDDLVRQGKIVSKRLGPGTQNMARGPAMTRDQAIRAVESGIEVVEALAETTDVFGTGDMGIANTTPSTAIASLLTGLPAATLCGAARGSTTNNSAKRWT